MKDTQWLHTGDLSAPRGTSDLSNERKTPRGVSPPFRSACLPSHSSVLILDGLPARALGLRNVGEREPEPPTRNPCLKPPCHAVSVEYPTPSAWSVYFSRVCLFSTRADRIRCRGAPSRPAISKRSNTLPINSRWHKTNRLHPSGANHSRTRYVQERRTSTPRQ